MKKYILSLAAVCCMLTFFSISAAALEYSFDAPDAGLFGRPTSDNTIYVTTDEPANTNRGKDAAYIPPAFGSPTSYTLNAGERLTPNLVSGSTTGAVSGTGGVTILPSNGVESGSWSYQPIGYTAVTSDLYYSGGYLATLKIPTLGLSVKVYQGTDSDALRKGWAFCQHVYLGRQCGDCRSQSRREQSFRQDTYARYWRHHQADDQARHEDL